MVNCHEEWNGGVSSLGQDGMGWDGKREGGNIEHRTPNIEHRSEEKLEMRTNPTLQRLNPFHPVLRRVEANREIDKLRPKFRITIR